MSENSIKNIFQNGNWYHTFEYQNIITKGTFDYREIIKTLGIPSLKNLDVLDVVYVLYKCSLVTEHRKTEIREYLTLILGVIQKHYFDQGGFSYFKDSCQTHYYGVKIANKFKCPDLHGTILLIWAISMIDSFLKDGNSKFNILKP